MNKIIAILVVLIIFSIVSTAMFLIKGIELHREIRKQDTFTSSYTNTIDIEENLNNENETINGLNNVGILRPIKETDLLFQNLDELEIFMNENDFIYDEDNDFFDFYNSIDPTYDAYWDGLFLKYTSSSQLSEFNNTHAVINESNGFRLGNYFVNDCWCEGKIGDGLGEYVEVEAFAGADVVMEKTGKEYDDVTINDMLNSLPIGYPSRLEDEPLQVSDENGNIIDYKDISINDVDKYFDTYIESIKIINGYAKSEETWKNNNRVKKLKLTIDDEEEYILEMDDTMTLKLFDIDYSKPISKPIKLKFEILEVYKGDKYSDTCLSCISLDGFTGAIFYDDAYWEEE